MKKHVLFFILTTVSGFSFAQGCCSGGSASPIAGGTSQGVLNEKQLEIAPNFQFTSSNRFFAGDRDTVPMINKLSSDYLYMRVAYGISPKLTLSIESGYFLKKEQIGLNNSDTIKTSGIADLIIFPRYEVFKKSTDRKKTELVVGLGYKLPIGSHDDSTVFYTDQAGKDYYTYAPPTVQRTNGSNDFIFYSFLFNNYYKRSFRVFANAIYVHKSWNSLGQKFGDYSSVSVFVGKTFYKHLGVTVQLKGEHVGRMKSDKLVDMVAYYNIYPESTGSRNVFIAPQLSYTYKTLTVYALSEIPVYQYVNGSQIGSQYQFTAGLSYKIDCSKKSKDE